jgi:hypothetical protein
VSLPYRGECPFAMAKANTNSATIWGDNVRKKK